jgi:hypothetical protein
MTALRVPDRENLDTPENRPDTVIDVLADCFEEHPADAPESFVARLAPHRGLDPDELDGSEHLIGQKIRSSGSVHLPPGKRRFELSLRASGQDDQQRVSPRSSAEAREHVRRRNDVTALSFVERREEVRFNFLRNVEFPFLSVGEDRHGSSLFELRLLVGYDGSGFDMGRNNPHR